VVLDLIAPHYALADGRGVVHVVDTARSALPPFTALCARQIPRSSANLRGRIDGPRSCPDCVRRYRHALGLAQGTLSLPVANPPSRG